LSIFGSILSLSAILPGINILIAVRQQTHIIIRAEK
jgi:hypothetical protein